MDEKINNGSAGDTHELKLLLLRVASVAFIVCVSVCSQKFNTACASQSVHLC